MSPETEGTSTGVLVYVCSRCTLLSQLFPRQETHPQILGARRRRARYATYLTVRREKAVGSDSARPARPEPPRSRRSFCTNSGSTIMMFMPENKLATTNKKRTDEAHPRIPRPIQVAPWPSSDDARYGHSRPVCKRCKVHRAGVGHVLPHNAASDGGPLRPL